MPVPADCFDVEKVYPMQATENDQGGFTFVRMRTKGKVSSYGLTQVSRKDGEDIELKRIITAREYRHYMANRDMSRHVVCQRRITFHWELSHWSINVYVTPPEMSGLAVLYVQTDTSDEEWFNHGGDPNGGDDATEKGEGKGEAESASGDMDGGGAGAAGAGTPSFKALPVGAAGRLRAELKAGRALSGKNKPLATPEWLQIDKEVTGEPNFSSRFISTVAIRHDVHDRPPSPAPFQFPSLASPSSPAGSRKSVEKMQTISGADD